jgi:hypothetical protein
MSRFTDLREGSQQATEVARMSPTARRQKGHDRALNSPFVCVVARPMI